MRIYVRIQYNHPKGLYPCHVAGGGGGELGVVQVGVSVPYSQVLSLIRTWNFIQVYSAA